MKKIHKCKVCTTFSCLWGGGGTIIKIDVVTFDVMKTNKEYIVDTIDDMVADFIYYDKVDENERIAEAIKNGDITINEMVKAFKESLIRELK